MASAVKGPIPPEGRKILLTCNERISQSALTYARDAEETHRHSSASDSHIRQPTPPKCRNGHLRGRRVEPVSAALPRIVLRPSGARKDQVLEIVTMHVSALEES